MQAVPANFAGAIKGKKSISSLRDAADSELAGAKIAASQIGDSIRANLASYGELAVDHTLLFNDLQQLVLKANDDLVALIKVRISDHQKAEEVTAEATRTRIRNEELQRIEDEAKAKAKAVVEPVVQSAPVVTSAPTRTAPVSQAAQKPTATQTTQTVAMQADVYDLEALIKAVAYGQAPISMLKVDWENLDALVADQGAKFSMAGVRLVKVAA